MLAHLKNIIDQPDGLGLLGVALAIGFLIGILFMRIVPPYNIQ